MAEVTFTISTQFGLSRPDHMPSQLIIDRDGEDVRWDRLLQDGKVTSRTGQLVIAEVRGGGSWWRLYLLDDGTSNVVGYLHCTHQLGAIGGNFFGAYSGSDSYVPNPGANFKVVFGQNYKPFENGNSLVMPYPDTSQNFDVIKPDGSSALGESIPFSRMTNVRSGVDNRFDPFIWTFDWVEQLPGCEEKTWKLTMIEYLNPGKRSNPATSRVVGAIFGPVQTESGKVIEQTGVFGAEHGGGNRK